MSLQAHVLLMVTHNKTVVVSTKLGVYMGMLASPGQESIGAVPGPYVTGLQPGSFDNVLLIGCLTVVGTLHCCVMFSYLALVSLRSAWG